MNNIANLEEFRKRIGETSEVEDEEEVRTLSDEQIERILYSTIEGREEMPSEEEMVAVLVWAHHTTVRTGMLNLIYEGELNVRWDEENEDLIVTAREE